MNYIVTGWGNYKNIVRILGKSCRFAEFIYDDKFSFLGIVVNDDLILGSEYLSDLDVNHFSDSDARDFLKKHVKKVRGNE